MLDNKTTTRIRNMTFKTYKRMKLKMLKDFCITLTPEQLDRFKTLKTEIEVDNFCITMINNNIKTYQGN